MITQDEAQILVNEYIKSNKILIGNLSNIRKVEYSKYIDSYPKGAKFPKIRGFLNIYA